MTFQIIIMNVTIVIKITLLFLMNITGIDFQGSKKTNSSETKKRTTRKRKVKKTARKRKRRRRTERVQDEAAVNNDFVKRKLTERRPLGSASLERTLSFSLFGNKFDLDEFEEPEPEEKPKREELKR